MGNVRSKLIFAVTLHFCNWQIFKTLNFLAVTFYLSFLIFSD